ncbi:MAG: hypothetical protein ACRDRI_01310 [Pseudonocardiaceae bacterium]
MVGSRPRDAAGDLLGAFGPAARQVALDTARYFQERDLVEYALASLRLVGDERQASPYAEESAARPAAQRIAELARGNFLIAGLVARTHGLYDEVPVTPKDLAIPSNVHAALREYAGRIQDISAVAALDVLTALAYARTPGLPLALWQAALYPVAVDRGALTAFAHSAAATFLIESNDAGEASVYQLFHQALGDALLAVRADLGLREEDERLRAGAVGVRATARMDGRAALPAACTACSCYPDRTAGRTARRGHLSAARRSSPIGTGGRAHSLLPQRTGPGTTAAADPRGRSRGTGRTGRDVQRDRTAGAPRRQLPPAGDARRAIPRRLVRHLSAS